MKWLIILYGLIALSFEVETGVASVIKPVSYSFTDPLIQYPEVNFFVICENCPEEQLKVYVPPKPIVSIAIKEPEIKDQKDTKPSVIEVFQLKEQKMSHTDTKTDPDISSKIIVYFDFNSFKLKPEEALKLRRLIQEDVQVVSIVGHTCPIGDDHYNLYLGEKRAKAVADYLKPFGVKILSISSKGEAEIISPQFELLRRAEITYTKGGGKSE